jgi:hypothetical protein
VQRVRRAPLDLKVLLELRVRLDLLGLLDRKANKDLRALLESLVQLVLLALREKRVQLDPKVLPVRRVLPVLPARLDPKDRQGRRVQLGPSVPQGLKVHRDRKEVLE